jgi:hypothetical protein
MDNGIEQLVEEIVTEIAISTDNIPWLILEGATDEKFFLSRLPGAVRLLVAHGWENVVKVVNKVNDENIRGILGVIDRDYREELGIFVLSDNIVVTDYRDIEVMMFYSSAFRKVVVEKASQNKWPKCANGEIDYEKIRQSIVDIAIPIGRFRFHCQKEGMNAKFSDSESDIDFSKIIDYKQSFDFTSKYAYVKHLKNKYQKENKHLEDNDWDQAQKLSLPIRLQDEKFIVSGHELIEIFGLSLRRKWGNKNKNEVTKEKLEESFRLSYPDEEFRKTSLYQEIFDWLHTLAV